MIMLKKTVAMACRESRRWCARRISTASRLHLGCISAASRRHLGCISDASRHMAVSAIDSLSYPPATDLMVWAGITA